MIIVIYSVLGIHTHSVHVYIIFNNIYYPIEFILNLNNYIKLLVSEFLNNYYQINILLKVLHILIIF